MSLTNEAAAGVLDQCINGTAFAAAGTPHISLGINGGAELSGTGYARVQQDPGAATLAQPSVSTWTEVNFGTVGADWTPVTGVDEVRIYSALTAGTLLATDTDTPVTFSTGNRAFVAAGMAFSFGTNSVFSGAYAQSINEWLWRSGAAPARARYLGILNSGTELSGGNYARLDTDSLFGSATVADPSVIAFTAGNATFQSSATFTGTANQLGLYAALSGGSPLITIPVAPQTIANGNLVVVAPTVTLT